MLFGFKQGVCLDAEYGTAPDGSPRAICAVLHTLPDHRVYRLWLLGKDRWPELPISTRDPDTVWIAYNVPAEVSVLLALKEPLPLNWIDFFLEYRAITNGHRDPNERTRLVEALAYFNEFSIDAEEKEFWQQMAQRYDLAELEDNREGMLDYCEHTDVDALVALATTPRFRAGLAAFHRDEVLFRGRSQVARARVVGCPVAAPTINKLKRHRGAAWLALTQQAQRKYQWGATDDTGAWHPLYNEAGNWNQHIYEKWVAGQGIELPRSKKSKQLRRKVSVLEAFEIKHPVLTPLRRTIHQRQILQNFDVPVTEEGRSIWFANPGGSITGRDQPSSAKNLFGLPKMFRSLIRPTEDTELAYFDVSGEEVWIGSRVSGSVAMEQAYRQDIYTQSLRQAGWTAARAKADRNKRGKPYVLAVGYGQSSHGLAPRLEIHEEAAAELIWRYRYRNFPEFNRYQRAIVNGAQRRRKTYFTPLGWPYWTGKLRSIRSMMNFPFQSGGADYMRLVLIMATEAGIRICCCVHDGFLIEAPTTEIENAMATMRLIMEAAGIALYGSAPIIKCEQRVRYPNSFDPGLNREEQEIWNLILQTVDGIDTQEAA